MHIVNIMCILSTDAYVMYISFLLLLFAYVHVIRILSEHLHIMHTLFAVVLDIFLPNRQCQCHPYVISSTLYISYHVQLSFCTLSAQMPSLVLFIYTIMYNLVSAHCLHRCTLSMSFAHCPHMYTSFACHLYHSSYTLLSTT